MGPFYLPGEPPDPGVRAVIEGGNVRPDVQEWRAVHDVHVFAARGVAPSTD
jgi:hypothetical protein